MGEVTVVMSIIFTAYGQNLWWPIKCISGRLIDMWLDCLSGNTVTVNFRIFFHSIINYCASLGCQTSLQTLTDHFKLD